MKCTMRKRSPVKLANTRRKSPFVMRKLPHKNTYRVFNRITHKVFSCATTRTNAQRQMGLLRTRVFRRR